MQNKKPLVWTLGTPKPPGYDTGRKRPIAPPTPDERAYFKLLGDYVEKRPILWTKEVRRILKLNLLG